MKHFMLLCTVVAVLLPLTSRSQLAAVDVAAAPADAMNPPAAQTYTIELRYLTPPQAVALLAAEKYKAFVPKEISGIVAPPKGQKLLFNSTTAQAAVTLSQLVSLLDQPADIAVEMMLIIVARPFQPGDPQPMPGAPANSAIPSTQEAVYAWTRSLLEKGCGGAIILPAQGARVGVPISVEVPPLLKWPLTLNLLIGGQPLQKPDPNGVARPLIVHLSITPTLPPGVPDGVVMPNTYNGAPVKREIALPFGKTGLVFIGIPGLLPAQTNQLFLAITLKQQAALPTVAILHNAPGALPPDGQAAFLHL